MKTIQKKEDFLEEMTQKANQVCREEIKPLREEKEAKERIREAQGDRQDFIDSLKDGSKTLGLIEDESEELEERKRNLERDKFTLNQD